MTDFGRDLRTVVDANGNVDITPGMLESTGRAVLAERLVRRQTTPLGSVQGAPNDCFDIRDWMSKEFDPKTISQLRGTIRQELLKDVGCLEVEVTMTYDQAVKKLTIREQVTSSDGPFLLTIAVTALTLDILLENA